MRLGIVRSSGSVGPVARGGFLGRGGFLLGGLRYSLFSLTLCEFFERAQLRLLLVRLRAGGSVFFLRHRGGQLRLRVLQALESVERELAEERGGLAEATQPSDRLGWFEFCDLGIEGVRVDSCVFVVVLPGPFGALRGLGSRPPLVVAVGMRGDVAVVGAGGSVVRSCPSRLRPLRSSLRLLLVTDLTLAHRDDLRALDVLAPAELVGLGLALARDLRREQVHGALLSLVCRAASDKLSPHKNRA